MTTLMIDDDLGKKAKKLAAVQGKTLDQFVSDLLQGAIGATKVCRDDRAGVPVLALDPPKDIDPRVIRNAIEEEGF
jgi:hypothetical protein